MNPAQLLNPKAFAKEQAKKKQAAAKKGMCNSTLFVTFAMSDVRSRLSFTSFTSLHFAIFFSHNTCMCMSRTTVLKLDPTSILIKGSIAVSFQHHLSLIHQPLHHPPTTSSLPSLITYFTNN
jgi:hypothetical protein